MASHEVKILKVIGKEAIENADNIERLKVLGYHTIVKKSDNYKIGDLVAYIPEESLIPQWILEEQGLWDSNRGKGRLAGKNGNRLKIVKLRGAISQGLVLPVNNNELEIFNPESGMFYSLKVELGQNVKDELSIKKYEPPIPANLKGEVTYIGGRLSKFDLENIKNFPDLIPEGTEVVFTEKLHGTQCNMGILPGIENNELFGEKSEYYVTSKGLGGDRKVVFKNNKVNETNLYVKMIQSNISKLDMIRNHYGNSDINITGEVYGKHFDGSGIQNLTYGAETPKFKIFSVRVDSKVLTYEEKKEFAAKFGFELVPLLYKGPFSMKILDEYTKGKSVIPNSDNIREGVVIETTKPLDNIIILLKSISEDYLLMNGRTDFN